MSIMHLIQQFAGKVSLPPADWASSLGSRSAWNKANPASQQLPHWVSPTSLPGEVPLGSPRHGIQEYVNPLVMNQARRVAPRYFPFDATGMHGNPFSTPMGPTHRPIVNNVGMFDPHPQLQAAARPIAIQGGRGTANIQRRQSNQPKIMF